ncbi:tyrosinase family protein [Blastococcus sp. SYSU DS0533]
MGRRRAGPMRDPNTAALDPIFWLHHANIDRLRAAWIAAGHRDPGSHAWLGRRFSLRTEEGTAVRMRPSDVLDMAGQLDHSYEGLPEAAPVPERGIDVSDRPRPVLIGATEEITELTPRGATVAVEIGPVRESGAGGERAGTPRTYLNVATSRRCEPGRRRRRLPQPAGRDRRRRPDRAPGRDPVLLRHRAQPARAPSSTTAASSPRRSRGRDAHAIPGHQRRSSLRKMSRDTEDEVPRHPLVSEGRHPPSAPVRLSG